MTKELVVGCPVYKRDWILPTYVDTVVREAKGLDVNLTFVFVYDRADTATTKLLWDLCDYPLWLLESTQAGKDAEHKWVPEDFHRMVSIRNQMLRKVRDLAPDLFFSLDSDMLLRDGALEAMIEAISEGYDAIGVSTSMCHSRWCESWMYYVPSDKSFARLNQPADFTGTKHVDAIMGGKLMTPAAYNVDYKWDVQGEDLGWCRNAMEEELRLGVTYKGQARHVMTPDSL